MLELQRTRKGWGYPILRNPVPRVMKFERFKAYFDSLPQGELVLDYGAGDRPLEPMLREKFATYIAADWPPANAAHSRRPDIEIGDGPLAIDDGTVDCVVLTEVMEHLYEPKQVLREIRRVLKPGGALIGTAPFAIGEHEQPYDFHRYTSFCLRRMFEETGFEVIDVRPVGDMVGVSLVTTVRVLEVLPKAIRRVGLQPLSYPARLLVRLPELGYYGLLRLGIDPGRLAYFRTWPLGYAFHVVKQADDH